MRDQGFFSRFIYPLALVMGFWAASSYIYNVSGTFEPGLLKKALVAIFGPALFVSIWFMALIGPPMAYFRGARAVERFIIAFANPVIWIVRVEAEVACQYNTAELVYFFFLPWIFGLVCLTLTEFALGDIVCRIVHKFRRPGQVRIFPPLLVLFLVLGAAGTWLAFINGQQWVYFLVHNYAEFFLR